MKKLNTFFLTLLMLPISSLWSAEVDSFTLRHRVLSDSLGQINKKTNEYFQKAVDVANEKADQDEPCKDKDLYKAMRKYFNNQYQGELGKYIVKNEEFDRTWVAIEDGIYQDFKWYQSFVQGFWGRRVAKDPTAANLNVNGIRVGTDKFEHFMGSGFRYYKKNYIKGDGVRAAMAIGEGAETGLLGAITTGVMAYSDLAANFNGMRFWNHVLLRYDDVLGEEHNLGPYVKCVDNKWSLVKEMDWSDYIDHTFDEGLNCSKFPNSKMLGMVQKRIKEAEKKNGMSLTCPVTPEKINNLIPKYGEFAEALINAEGHGALKMED
jgi:hypothetical protein